jgi:hypothetical protein
MESLTRNNYEIWFLDYLDGQLSNEQLETLLDFLEQNPDLQKELQGVSKVGLAAGNEMLDQKEFLLKTPEDIPGIGSLDQLCIARMENDLSVEEAILFDKQLDTNPVLEREYAAFLQTRLDPSDKVVYPYKSELKKKVVFFNPWVITAISSAAIVLLAWILWPNNSEKEIPAMAKLEEPAKKTSTPADSIAVKPDLAITNGASANSEGSASKTEAASSRNIQKPDTWLAGKDNPALLELPVRESVPMKSLARRYPLSGPRIPDPMGTKILYASNYPSAFFQTMPSEDALTIPQYALQLFREKILGQDPKQVRETRFSMWEVAGAGVNKINDLAGTQMKLNREYDPEGDIVAVSFNSRLLDVEAPIRAQEDK